jgi:beta-lysine 5,6-aminomutase beta subunit
MTGELGVDKIFGKGTTPGEVASYLAYALAPDEAAAQEVGAIA